MSREDYSGRGVVLPWPAYVAWLRGHKHSHVVRGQDVPLPPPWRPGQHWAMVGKTREGKSNFAVAVLTATRRYVLALDPKGEDETLTASGWLRVAGVPPDARWPRDIQQRLDEGTVPVRVIVGHATRTREDDAANKQLLAQAVEYARQSGGWTLLVDEHQVASDPRMYSLGPPIARMSVSAASSKVSVVALMQYLSWVDKTPVRQASLVSVWKTKNRDLLKRLAEEVGRDWRELAQVVDELGKYDVLTVSDDVRAPVLVTRPPKVA